jgi:hypothetical protein
MPTESYGEFGLNGIGAGDGSDVLGPSCDPLAWVIGSRRSRSGSRARLGSKQHRGRSDKIDFEFIRMNRGFTRPHASVHDMLLPGTHHWFLWPLGFGRPGVNTRLKIGPDRGGPGLRFPGPASAARMTSSAADRTYPRRRPEDRIFVTLSRASGSVHRRSRARPCPLSVRERVSDPAHSPQPPRPADSHYTYRRQLLSVFPQFKEHLVRSQPKPAGGRIRPMHSPQDTPDSLRNRSLCTQKPAVPPRCVAAPAAISETAASWPVAARTRVRDATAW